MKKLKTILAEYITVFPLAKSLIILFLSYAVFAGLEVFAYFVIFKWDSSLPREALKMYFAVSSIAIGYLAAAWSPLIINEIFRYRRIKYLLTNPPVNFKKVIKKFNIILPQYEEFRMAGSKGDKASITFMVLWIFVSVLILAFFVLLRLPDLPDEVGLPALALTAATWGIPLCILIRLVGNYLVRRRFWEFVNPEDLEKSDTAFMQATEIIWDKKTIFRLRAFVLCQMVFEVFVLLYLFYKIEPVGLYVGTGVSAGVCVFVNIIYAIVGNRFAKNEADDPFVYPSKE
ncbi:MAG: hypothetical protein GX095_00090 [Clostridiales bacterium]|nr:hypothetical protein [Clostridiales bacterium]